MTTTAWIGMALISLFSIFLFYCWWTSPDDLEAIRQRERALKAMAKWTS